MPPRRKKNLYLVPEGGWRALCNRAFVFLVVFGFRVLGFRFRNDVFWNLGFGPGWAWVVLGGPGWSRVALKGCASLRRNFFGGTPNHVKTKDFRV